MEFKKELIKKFNEGRRSIKVAGLLTPKTKLHLKITSLNGKNISLNTLVPETDVGFQPRYEKDGVWDNMPYRLDNAHKDKSLHTHWIEDSIYPAEHILTIRDVFRSILGSEFNEEDFTLKEIF